MKKIPTFKEFLNEKDDFFSSRLAAQQLRKDTIAKIGEDKFHKMYKDIDNNIVLKAAKSAKWALSDKMSDEFLSSNSAIAGKTDYKDHTKDSFEQLKELVIKSLKEEDRQALNFYNIDGEIFDTIIVRPEKSGYMAKAYWSNKKPGFKEIARQIR